MDITEQLKEFVEKAAIFSESRLSGKESQERVDKAKEQMRCNPTEMGDLRERSVEYFERIKIPVKINVYEIDRKRKAYFKNILCVKPLCSKHVGVIAHLNRGIISFDEDNHRIREVGGVWDTSHVLVIQILEEQRFTLEDIKRAYGMYIEQYTPIIDYYSHRIISQQDFQDLKKRLQG